MDKVTIQLTHAQAYQHLQNMEKLHLIRVLHEPISAVNEPEPTWGKHVKLSTLRGRIKSKMSNDEIDEQLRSMRDEWERNI